MTIHSDEHPLIDPINDQRSRFGWTKWLSLATFAGLIGLAGWSYVGGGIVHTLLADDASADEKVVQLREFFHSFGLAAPLVYVGLVLVEVVVAPIPGAMLYAPGGLIFGGFWGGLLSLTGNVLGAGVACGLMRALGRPLAQRWLQGESLRIYEARLARRGAWIVFLLRVNPLTSTDLVSYAAGLTSMPISKVMLGTLLGMAPLCWAQAYLADQLLHAIPELIYPLLIACVIYTLCVLWIIRKLIANGRKTAPSE